MSVTDTLVGIDLGTTKIGAIIAEVDEDGDIQVVGVGKSASRGMRRGVRWIIEFVCVLESRLIVFLDNEVRNASGVFQGKKFG